MSVLASKRDPARRAIRVKGWLRAHKWLLARRSVQLATLGLFLTGPVFGLWIFKGTLASSTFLGVIPFTDPLIAAQALVAGHALAGTAILGVLVVVGLYVVVGGRAFCGWVCPVNLITDAAHRLRLRLGIGGGLNVARSARYWALGGVLAVSAGLGMIAWEAVNPVTILHREIVFGTLFVSGVAWMVVAAIFLFDAFVANRGWCGHLCPVGAAYGLIGLAGLARVSARRREACDNCNACYIVCPEPHVIRPALQVSERTSPVITSPDCTNCGRCIDVCSEDVFLFTHRFDTRTESSSSGASASSGAEAGGRAA